ncbi:unnamed protein product [Paramecium primaurelia]|uniref:Uncharacterized protein n=1 Tax=Paramecium primaurelia TaxID=5886 RepID=A0A8S1NUZ9_PARPR|nr:unnamed protein product [Paramecium primaurelia]
MSDYDNQINGDNDDNDNMVNNSQEKEEQEKKEYFKELVVRLKEVQAKIKQTKTDIENEKQLRQDAAIKLEEKREHIKKLLIKQNQTTTDKVEALIRDTLENLVQQTLQKQQELKDLKENEKERSFLNYELELQFRNLRKYVSDVRQELQESDQHAQKLKIQIQKQTNTNLLLRTDVDEKSQKIQQLKQEAQQLRATIQNLNDVKKVINRVSDQEQIIIESNVQKKPRNSQNNKSASQQRVNYNTHDVDDNFWYGEKQLKLPSVQSTRKKQ